MTNHVLRDVDGTLHLGDELLLCVYPAGDCDTISWPFGERDERNLTRALYDSYQCEEILKEGDTVSLPDGTHFGHTRDVHFIRDYKE